MLPQLIFYQLVTFCNVSLLPSAYVDYIFTCNVQEVDHFVSEYDLTLHVCGTVLDKVDLVYHGLAKL